MGKNINELKYSEIKNANLQAHNVAMRAIISIDVLQCAIFFSFLSIEITNH